MEEKDQPCGGCVRFVAISDTHGKHASLRLPPGDVLVHTGDFTENGDADQIDSFCKWLSEQPHGRKILIAGNHDLTLHGASYERACRDWGVPVDGCEAERCAAARARIAAVPDLEYLCCSGTEVEGIAIWGAPWVPVCGGVFTRERGQPLREVWDQIPAAVDVLLTHGPPRGHGDLCVPRGLGMGRKHAGCTELLEAVTQRVRPAYHVFGHIHEGHGTTTDGTTTFVNASSCTARGQCVQPPIVFDVPVRAKATAGDDGSRIRRPARCCCFTCLQELDDQLSRVRQAADDLGDHDST